ncbi:hypothetical protein ACH5RR_001168 [Cinchona calisaya]|uniref:Reverse transcriptase domain-containing protein n=1 Tax=Cinchona calisaya TaxID=153742 RepID=A0ABD3B2M7_9GENT
MDVVFSLNSDSLARVDGFNRTFLKTCWKIVVEDLHNAAKEFLQGVTLPKAVTRPLVCLIPNTKNLFSFGDFRPISLWIFTNKVPTKVLAKRLGGLLRKIILEELSGFASGRIISDNILIAWGLVESIDNKVRGGNLVIKLDMTKALDRVSWPFLYKILSKFGLTAEFISLISNYIENNWLSILFNGSPTGFFKSSRGVRQGDPLSPSLFIIVAETFVRGLRNQFQTGRIGYYAASRSSIPITHLMQMMLSFSLEGIKSP